MDINKLKSLLDDFEKNEPTSFTPFGLSKLVNRYLGTNLPPQMFYNYIGNGYIDAHKINGKWNITKKEGKRFLEKYAINNVVTSINNS